ncbi:MAG: hypothetical protein L6R39_004371 [Caloplaca ligustica]|nr:MAG: hypothetical protein L6R39_004371 [Caloplaca ligustica]
MNIPIGRSSLAVAMLAIQNVLLASDLGLRCIRALGVSIPFGVGVDLLEQGDLKMSVHPLQLLDSFRHASFFSFSMPPGALSISRLSSIISSASLRILSLRIDESDCCNPRIASIYSVSISAAHSTYHTVDLFNAMSANTNSSSSSKPQPKQPERPSVPRSKSQPTLSSSAAKPGEATAAYKHAQSKLHPRETTPSGGQCEGAGSKASSQACESGEVSENERGVMRKDRKDVHHEGPGFGKYDGN